MNATPSLIAGALLVAIAAFASGCASTPVPAAEAPVSAEQVAIVSPPPGPPDQVDVAWEDNGVAIRPLSGPGHERQLAQPSTATMHRGGLSVAPPSNADGFAKKPAKKR